MNSRENKHYEENIAEQESNLGGVLSELMGSLKDKKANTTDMILIFMFSLIKLDAAQNKKIKNLDWIIKDIAEFKELTKNK